MSKISFRLFNQNMEDKYPDITFCIEGNHLKSSTEEFQASSDTVTDILKGKFEFNNSDDNLSKNIIKAKSDSLFIDLSEILLSFSFITNTKRISYTKQSLVSYEPQKKIQSFFHTNYLGWTSKYGFLLKWTRE